MFHKALVVVWVLTLSSYALGKKVGYCRQRGNLYTVSSHDCRCFHQRDISNGNEGYHRCPGSLTFNPYTCVCDSSASTCHGSAANLCPPAGQLNGAVHKSVGDGYCERRQNRYTISNKDCTCFHQKDLTNGNNGYHRCPAPLKFNPAVCVCDWPWNFKCKGSKANICPGPYTPTDGNINPDGLSCKSHGNLYTIKSKDCKCFKQVDMSNGNFGYQCCPIGTTFNPAVCVCDHYYNSVCKAKTLITVDDPQCKKCQDCDNADIVFVADGSGSIRPNFPKIKQFIKTVINRLQVAPGKTHVGVSQFSVQAKKEFFLTSNKFFALSEVDAIVFQNGAQTRIDRALRHAREVMFSTANGARNPATGISQIIFFITDGGSTGGNVAGQALLNRQAGIRTYAIGIGSSINQHQLKIIASKPENVFPIDDFDELENLAKELC